VKGAACICAGESITGEQTHASHWCFSSYWQFGVVMQPIGAPAHLGSDGSGVCVICAPCGGPDAHDAHASARSTVSQGGGRGNANMGRAYLVWAPWRLRDAGAGVAGMTLAGPDLYWSEGNTPGAVVSAPQVGLGSGVPLSIASNETYPWNIAVDAANVYWTAEGPNSTPSANYGTFVAGYVATCPIAVCPSSGPRMLATNLHNPRGIAVDDVAVYFTVFGNATGQFNPPTEGSVMKIAK